MSERSAFLNGVVGTALVPAPGAGRPPYFGGAGLGAAGRFEGLGAAGFGVKR